MATGVQAAEVDSTRQKLGFGTAADSPDTYVSEAVIREAYSRLGIDFEVLRFPGGESLQKSNSGEIDGEVARIDGISRKYHHLIQVPIPINYLRGAVFSTDHELTVKWWNNLKPYRVGIVRGIIFAEQGTEGMDVKKVDSYLDLLTLLDEGLVDFIIAPEFALLVWANNEYSHLNLRNNGVLEASLIYHYLHEKHADLVPRVATVLKAMIYDGTAAQIRKNTMEQLLRDGIPKDIQ